MNGTIDGAAVARGDGTWRALRRQSGIFAAYFAQFLKVRLAYRVDFAVDLFAKAGGFETVQYRDALGVSRKYAVPLLDYFDTVRLTVRSGSRRTPGAAAKAEL